VNGAVALARRARHDRHAGGEKIVLGQLERGAAAAEQLREELLESLVQLVEGLLETGPGLAVDFSNYAFEGLQGTHQVGVLGVEVGLALGLLLELVDGDQVDRTDAVDPAADVLESLPPGLLGRLFGHFGREPLGIVAPGLDLLGYRFEFQLDLARLELLLAQALAFLVDHALDAGQLLLPFPYRQVDSLAVLARDVEFAFDRFALAEQTRKLVAQRCFGVADLLERLVEPRRSVGEFLAPGVEPPQGLLEGASPGRFDLPAGFRLVAGVAVALVVLPRFFQLRRQPFAPLAPVTALSLVESHPALGLVEPPARRRQPFLAARDLLDDLGVLAGEALPALAELGEMRLLLAKAVLKVRMFPVAVAQHLAAPVALGFRCPKPVAQLADPARHLRQLPVENAEPGLDGADFLLAGNQAEITRLRAGQPYPVGADEDAVARHRHLPGCESRPQRQRIF